MAQTLPPALEQDLRKFDTMQRNYEMMAAKLQTWQMELNQVKVTLEELNKQPDDVVTYKSVGQILFKVDKPSTAKDLADREEVLEKTLKSMKKKVESLAASLKELQEKIQLELSKQNLRLQ